jgi:hypothetical protein
MAGKQDRRGLTRPIAGGLMLAVAGLLALSPSAASASDAKAKPPKAVYAITFAPNSALYRLSPRSHRVSRVGRTNAELTDLSFRRGTLYAISFTALYRMNARTGACHEVGSLGLSDANALTTQPKKRTLYGAGQSGDFFKVNARTGQATIIGTFGHGLGSAGDLTFANGRLYGTVSRPGSVRSFLAIINVRTGAAKIVGNTRYKNVYGLVTGRDALYGATFGGKFLLISPRTGRGKVIWNDGIAVGGLATPAS